MTRSHVTGIAAAAVLCLPAVFLSTLARAADPDTSSEPLIEEMVVWGTQVRASSVLLEGDALAIRQADHISDLLRTIPGVDVGGAHSLNQRITIRSMDDKDLWITIDGANQNTYMYHHMGNLQIHADILEAVDIEVGNNSVANSNLGGTVRFETREAKSLLRDGARWGGRVQGSYADNASEGLSLSGYGQLSDSLDGILYYNYVDRHNYEVGGGEILDANGDEIPGTDGKVRGQAGELDHALGKLGWDIGARQRLEVGYEYYQDEGDYSYRPDMGLATDISIGDSLGLPLTYPTEFTRDTLTLNYELGWGGDNLMKASLFRNESNLQRDETAISELWPGDPAHVEGRADNTGINILAESGIAGDTAHTLVYGLDYVVYDTEYRPDGVTGAEEQAKNFAVFLEDRIDFAMGLSVIPGVRYASSKLDATLTDGTFDEFTGAIAAEYMLNEQILLRLSTTQLFKAPEIGEVFIGAGLYDTPNPGIQAETGFNSEFVVAYEDDVLGADRFGAGITLFQTDLDDYIYDYAPTPPEVGGGSWKDNVGDMEIDGFEAYVSYDIGNFRSLFTYSVAESDLSAAPGYEALNGARLDRQQGDTISILLDYTFPSLGLSLHWNSLIVDDVPADLDLDGATLNNAKDGYDVHNVSVLWSPDRLSGLVLTFGVDNLFDEYYASQSSRTGVSFHPLFGELYLTDYEPGRNIKFTASYAF